MKLKSIKPRIATGDSMIWDVVFVHETGDVKKALFFAGCFEAVNGRDAIRKSAPLSFLKVAREAERDIAWKMFGDDWRQNCAWGPYQEYEMKRLQQAVSMTPDLFGEAA